MTNNIKWNPEIVKKEIDEILFKYWGLSQKTLVNEAKNENTELHKCFTWEDAAAAKQWRLSNVGQAESVNEAEAAEQWRLHEASQLVLYLSTMDDMSRVINVVR